MRKQSGAVGFAGFGAARAFDAGVGPIPLLVGPGNGKLARLSTFRDEAAIHMIEVQSYLAR